MLFFFCIGKCCRDATSFPSFSVFTICFHVWLSSVAVLFPWNCNARALPLSLSVARFRMLFAKQLLSYLHMYTLQSFDLFKMRKKRASSKFIPFPNTFTRTILIRCKCVCVCVCQEQAKQFNGFLNAVVSNDHLISIHMLFHQSIGRGILISVCVVVVIVVVVAFFFFAYVKTLIMCHSIKNPNWIQTKKSPNIPKQDTPKIVFFFVFLVVVSKDRHHKSRFYTRWAKKDKWKRSSSSILWIVCEKIERTKQNMFGGHSQLRKRIVDLDWTKQIAARHTHAT